MIRPHDRFDTHRNWIRAALLAAGMLASIPAALAQDAALWLTRAAAAAQQQNYMGTVVYQHGRPDRNVAPHPSER